MKLELTLKIVVGVLIVAASSLMAQKEIKNVLHFTAISGYNHKDGIRAGGVALDNLAEKYGFTVTHSKEPTEILNLSQYDVVVFNNNVSNGGMQGILKSEDQQQALVDYLEGGGLYLGFHGANDFDCTGWEWYYKTLHSGNCFRGHGGGQWTLETDADLKEDKELSAMWEDAGLEPTVVFKTEKYRMRKGRDPSIRDDAEVKVMQKLIEDNSDYDDHYFTWTKPIGKGRMIYSALGHGEGDFTQNDAWLEKATYYWMKYLAGHYKTPVSVEKGKELKARNVETGRVQLYDIKGSLVATHTGKIQGFDYSKMAKSGLYFAKIESSSGIISQKKVLIP